jgi:uncharacterized protein
MTYYVSLYANSIKTKYGYILFNGMNGAIDEVDNYIGKAFENRDITEIENNLNKGEIEHLLKRGYLTLLPPQEEEDVFKKFTTVLRQSMEKGNESGSFMLLLSYNCNLRCPYCYQQEHRHRNSGTIMSEGMVDLIFEKLYNKIIPNLKLEKTRIMFYGGEPFLPSNKPAIYRALEWAKKYGMRVSDITNATMIDTMPDIFSNKPGYVSWCQVSLDGSKRFHDKSRITADGRGTYEKILSNLKFMLEKGVSISLRLNLDRKKLESIQELMDELKSAGILEYKNLSIYASPLHDNIAKVDSTDFMDLYELSTKLLNQGIDLEHPVSSRANEMSLLFKAKKGLGLNRTDFCMQTSQRTVIVDPFGDLYSCFEEAGYPEYRIGRIVGEEVEFFPLKEHYRNRYVSNLNECTKCSVALACGGQCGIKSRIKRGDVYKVYCENMREIILQSLKFSYEKYKEEGFKNFSEGISSHD